MIPDWADALADSPWALVALLVATTVDGFFPPVPSESAVIGLAALTTSGRGPGLWAVGAVAALGAFAGDQVAYALGRRLSAGRRVPFRSRRARQAFCWAQDALEHRGAALVLGARFTPGGRVLVNMAAGAVGFSRSRFTALAAVGAVQWSACSVGLGVGAGHVLAQHHPALAVAAGVVGGLAVGAVVDRVLRRLTRRRVEPSAVSLAADDCTRELAPTGS